jgi:hypothetical protein
MPQPPIPEHWKERIKAHLAQIDQRNEKPSDKWIRDVLEKEAEDLREDGDAEMRRWADRVPSQRTISRIRKDDWPLIEEKDRARYRRFYWPESMQRGDLRWEASAAALELLREGERLLSNAWQPPIKAVRSFWYVTQAVPVNTPFWLRMGAAMSLMRAERNRDRELERAVQWFLVYEPWRGDSWAGTYKEAIDRRPDPIPAIPEDLMPLYRIIEPVPSDAEFLRLVRKLKLEWLDLFGSETLDSSQEEQNG